MTTTSSTTPPITQAVSVRLETAQLAKARDGLLAKGIKPTALLTKSQILRLSVYLAIMQTPEPSEPPSQESLDIFIQEL